MRKPVIVMCLLLVLGNVFVSVGCKKQGGSQSAASGVIVINHPHYAVGTHLSAPAWNAFYRRFTEKYKGEIELRIEELPSDTLYADKMKVLAATKELPDVVDGKDGVRALAIQNGQAVDLKSYLDSDPDFRDKVVGPGAVAANTIDGKVYSISTSAQVLGYYYNKELFQKAGISPAKTWDEWFSNCEKLKASGVAPIALMTGENQWTTNLILSAMVASRGPAGQAFMNTKYPETYQTPEMIAGLTDIQRCLQKYTTSDALGAAYANAANNFLAEQAAIISNGPWMIADFSNPQKTLPGFDKKVGWAMFPGDGLTMSFAEGYVLCAPPERRDAAWTLIKEISGRESQMERLRLSGQLPSALDLEIPQDVRDSKPLVADIANAIGKVKYHGDTFSVVAYASVIDAMGRYYPELVAGTLSPAQMAAKLDEAAAAAR
ncbi:MAG: extracellular solute-binding protein [Treponema sp.]|nr:extracellular solute-binding protein [Treponema sp.]